MQKIKFKIEYKPLADANINKHKNFDGLLAMYAAAPKLNFFQKLFKNKWTMFSGGIIIGSAITLFVTMQNNNHENSLAQSENYKVAQEQNETTAVTENNNPANNSLPDETIPTINSNTNEKDSDFPVAENSGGEKKSTTISASQNNKGNTSITNSKSNNKSIVASTANESDLNPQMKSEQETEKTQANKTENQEPENEKSELSVTDNSNNDQITGENNNDTQPEQQDIKLDLDKMIAEQEAKIKQNEEQQKAEKENISKESKESKAGDPDKKTFSEKLASIQLFEKDSSSLMGLSEDSLNEKQPETYINRYAQLSFFTPLSTNGIDSYKYSRHISFNIIQGYNGAVDGFEFGGVINADRGYVNGGQFAGVINAIGGDVKGFQGAGVGNFASNVKGFQGAGVMNIAIGEVSGFQGAGVMNITAKKVTGFQAAGVMNVSVSTDTAKYSQAAGVLNFSLAHSTGIQAAGVLNIANDHRGSQIGLINIAKNVHGVQIGLINIADSLDGISIGLLSISKNGIFDVDLSTNDLFTFNAGIRVGGPSIYNVFAFGVSPFADTVSYGYGLGIGGHIPISNNFFTDIDGMSWNVHKDQFEFNYDYLHMNNQLRVMPGYTLNKYISFYAGPVLNVEIYDNDIIPLHTNPLSIYTGSNISTALSFGYVVGVRFF